MRWLLLSLAWLTSTVFAAAAPQVLDDFKVASRWKAIHSEDVKAELKADPSGGLCLNYDFGRVSGFAGISRPMKIQPGDHFAFGLTLHGDAPVNGFQVKFLDASGENVWWRQWPNYAPPRKRAEMPIRQRNVEFAWGPTADIVYRGSESIQMLVYSGKSGGKGQVCFDRLTLTRLSAPAAAAPAVATAVGAQGNEASRAVDGNLGTAWVSPGAGTQTWQLDLGASREVNGVMVRFAGADRASDFDLDFSADGKRWRTVRRVRGSLRDALALWLPDGETRYLRLQLLEGPTPHYALAEVEAMTPAKWPELNTALKSMAAAAPRGRYPRGFVNEQNYWTLVGVDGGAANSALISEDGAIEPARQGPSLEPFVIDEQGAVISWANVTLTQSLRDGYLPLPMVSWSHDDFGLTIEAGAEGRRERSSLLVQYKLTNQSDHPLKLTLALAVRPWQVNPPQQFLNTAGGFAAISKMAWDASSVTLEGSPWLATSKPAVQVDARAFDQGDALDAAREATKPGTRGKLEDPQGLANIAMRFPIALAPGETRSVEVELPLAGKKTFAGLKQARKVPARLDAIAGRWRERLNRVDYNLPPDGQPIVDTLRTSLAHVMMSRDGPALQPATRSYARSWVRDGAMMAATLLRLNEPDSARQFVEWYSGFLFANGKVPCCVDFRGADPVPENDSHGEFIFSVGELYRHTQDKAFAKAMWPKVDAAARYMETLRQSERTDANRVPGREMFFGLMPRSISHEGYFAKPMHSYWDDFWALAGYRDAAFLAELLGLDERAKELGLQRDEFTRELSASLLRAVQEHKMNELPGAAELGDFDPTSSTLIFSPAGADRTVPRSLLEATWERAWKQFVDRRDSGKPWVDYTPYEIRSVGAYARLGHPERAHALLDFFFKDRRPQGWNQWAEVVGRIEREPRFIGDMPHAWISSDFIRSALDLLAFERESDRGLVLGAGVKREWLTHGVGVRGLSTSFGKLGYLLKQEGKVLTLDIDEGLSPPPGGIWFAWPGTDPLPEVKVGGQIIPWQGRDLPLPATSRHVEMVFP